MDPVVVGTVGARPLQGREPEMALLASLIDGVGSKGASLVLRGEPGIGKSRLLREAITLAEDRNMTVVSTSGVQAEARLPFAGLHQLLRPVRDRAAFRKAVAEGGAVTRLYVKRNGRSIFFGLRKDPAPTAEVGSR